jgi:hypothetical protein
MELVLTLVRISSHLTLELLRKTSEKQTAQTGSMIRFELQKFSMTRQAANSWHGFLVFCSGCGSQYAGKTLFFMFLTG